MLEDSILEAAGFSSNGSTGELPDKARERWLHKTNRQQGGRQLAGFDTLDIRQSALARLELRPLLEHEMLLIRQTHGDGWDIQQTEVFQTPQPPPSGARQAAGTDE